ncbi:hypothetical protein C8R44DRAFT_736763 [Mycena epipterygia]|nr:hypothetical protein C8R44DRAFT_736763 [Mycena epipterygia]
MRNSVKMNWTGTRSESPNSGMNETPWRTNIPFTGADTVGVGTEVAARSVGGDEPQVGQTLHRQQKLWLAGGASKGASHAMQCGKSGSSFASKEQGTMVLKGCDTTEAWRQLAGEQLAQITLRTACADVDKGGPQLSDSSSMGQARGLRAYNAPQHALHILHPDGSEVLVHKCHCRHHKEQLKEDQDSARNARRTEALLALFTPNENLVRPDQVARLGRENCGNSSTYTHGDRLNPLMWVNSQFVYNVPTTTIKHIHDTVVTSTDNTAGVK